MEGFAPSDSNATTQQGEQDELPKDLQNDSLRHRVRRRLRADIDPKRADVVLILGYFIAGLVDSVAYNTYSCFVSMQTGNTIFVGLGLLGQPTSSPSFGWTKSLTSIACFCLGAFFFSRYHRFFSPLRRWVLVTSFAIQALFVTIAAILVTIGVVSRLKATSRDLSSGVRALSSTTETVISAPTTNSRSGGSSHDVIWVDLAPLALLSFQSAGQVVMSRVLKYTELPGSVLTSLYCDLVSDPHLFTAGLFDDPKRNRRALAALVLFIGAIFGGWCSKTWFGLAGALWIAAAIKYFLVLAWFMWTPATPPESEDEA